MVGITHLRSRQLIVPLLRSPPPCHLCTTPSKAAFSIAAVTRSCTIGQQPNRRATPRSTKAPCHTQLALSFSCLLICASCTRWSRAMKPATPLRDTHTLNPFAPLASHTCRCAPLKILTLILKRGGRQRCDSRYKKVKVMAVLFLKD